MGAHSRVAMEVMVLGWAISFCQASQAPGGNLTGVSKPLFLLRVMFCEVLGML